MKIKHLIIANIVAFSFIACGQAEQKQETTVETEEVVEVVKAEAPVVADSAAVEVADSTVVEVEVEKETAE